MLSKRQNLILDEFNEKPGEYIKTNYFAEKYGVTVRSIQNDIKNLVEELRPYENSFILETTAHRGTKLIIKDTDSYHSFIEGIKSNCNSYNLNYKEDRTNKLLHFLLNQTKPISLVKCSDFIFVSKSTITLDLKELETILEKYSLKLVQSKGDVLIEGLERDKRMCLIDNDNFYVKSLPGDSIMEADAAQISLIKKILIDNLVKCQYPISDAEYRDLVIWLDVSTKRIKNLFTLGPQDVYLSQEFEKEMQIARGTMEKISRKLLIDIPETETVFLAMYLNNHGSVLDPNYISPEMTNFISEALQKLSETFPSSFVDDMDLSLSLALHCAPLISRARNNIQLKNKMVVYVKQNFQYAFDIASYFGYLLSQKFNVKISEDEISFITIYFNRSMIEQSRQIGKKKVCIVTSLKRSAYFLLEQYLYNTFQNHIASITFLTNDEAEETDLEQFDVFFSTENSRIVEAGLATKINCFPDDNEVKKLRAIIEGYGTAENVMDMFDPRLFFIEDYDTKNEVLDCLVKKAKKLYNLDLLSKEIELREEFGSTYFGNGIAILHPMHYLGSTSFIGEVLLKKPIIWDGDGNRVRTVFLVCLQRNNLNAFQTWNYITPIIFDPTFRKKANDVRNFEDFKKLCSEMIKNK